MVSDPYHRDGDAPEADPTARTEVTVEAGGTVSIRRDGDAEIQLPYEEALTTADALDDVIVHAWPTGVDTGHPLHAGEHTLALIDLIQGRGHTITRLTFDRGYNYLPGFHEALRIRNIPTVQDYEAPEGHHQRRRRRKVCPGGSETAGTSRRISGVRGQHGAVVFAVALISNSGSGAYVPQVRVRHRLMPCSALPCRGRCSDEWIPTRVRRRVA